jgi:hypothetical protein
LIFVPIFTANNPKKKMTMKKIIAICIVAAFATSCKKDYSCECTSVDTSNGTTTTTVDTYKASSSKKDAQAWCDAIPKSKAEVGGSPVSQTAMTCALK